MVEVKYESVNLMGRSSPIDVSADRFDLGLEKNFNDHPPAEGGGGKGTEIGAHLVCFVGPW